MEAVTVLIRHRVDGLIIAPANSQNRALRAMLIRLGVPVVALDRPLSGAPIPSVVADNFAGARQATSHLIEHGRKRILCLTGEPSLYTIRERIRGYRRAIESAGLECILDTSVTDYQSAERVLEKLMRESEPPDAIFTLKNSTTIYAFEVLKKMKIRIPGSVALMGYDDFELAATVRPSISVVQQPVEETGRMAAEILFRELLDSGNAAGSSSARVQKIQLRTQLIRRSSCGCSEAEE